MGSARVARLDGGVWLHGRVECGDEVLTRPVIEGNDGTLVQDLDRCRLTGPEHELGSTDAPDRRRVVDDGPSFARSMDIDLSEKSVSVVMGPAAISNCCFAPRYKPVLSVRNLRFLRFPESEIPRA